MAPQIDTETAVGANSRRRLSKLEPTRQEASDGGLYKDVTSSAFTNLIHCRVRFVCSNVYHPRFQKTTTKCSVVQRSLRLERTGKEERFGEAETDEHLEFLRKTHTRLDTSCSTAMKTEKFHPRFGVSRSVGNSVDFASKVGERDTDMDAQT